MAMTAAGLKAAIIAAFPPAEDSAVFADFADHLATAIVGYITANAKATIPAGAIDTTGSSSAQSGPAAPVLCSIS